MDKNSNVNLTCFLSSLYKEAVARHKDKTGSLYVKPTDYEEKAATMIADSLSSIQEQYRKSKGAKAYMDAICGIPVQLQFAQALNETIDRVVLSKVDSEFFVAHYGETAWQRGIENALIAEQSAASSPETAGS